MHVLRSMQIISCYVGLTMEEVKLSQLFCDLGFLQNYPSSCVAVPKDLGELSKNLWEREGCVQCCENTKRVCKSDVLQSFTNREIQTK